MIGIFAALNTLYLARFTYWALQARGRKRARIAVLQGRIAADAILSPSTIAVDPARAPDIQVEPFSMLHVARRRARPYHYRTFKVSLAHASAAGGDPAAALHAICQRLV